MGYSSEMSKQAFNDFVSELAYHFGQDKYVKIGEATRKRLSSWYYQVKHLPNEPLEWMATKIKNENDYFPRNLSKTMLNLWDQWYTERPQKQISQKEGCQNCHDGWILAYPPEELYPRAVKCAHCSKSKPEGVWITTIQELKKRGWVLESERVNLKEKKE